MQSTITIGDLGVDRKEKTGFEIAIDFIIFTLPNTLSLNILQMFKIYSMSLMPFWKFKFIILFEGKSFHPGWKSPHLFDHPTLGF